LAKRLRDNETLSREQIDDRYFPRYQIRRARVSCARAASNRRTAALRFSAAPGARSPFRPTWLACTRSDRSNESARVH
jgi:hypothetical protein